MVGRFQVHLAFADLAISYDPAYQHFEHIRLHLFGKAGGLTNQDPRKRVYFHHHLYLAVYEHSNRADFHGGKL